MNSVQAVADRPDVAARRRATLVGGIAILLWATLALFTTLVPSIPPFQLIAVTFGIAAAVSFVVTALRGQNPFRVLRQPVGAWALGVGGLFGYHFFYFVALRNAPPVEANLINYLWPLLIVVFAALLVKGERLGWRHIAGTAAGLAGTLLLVGRGGFSASLDYMPGYLAALGAALTWSGYSVLNRRYDTVPTEAVGGFCLATAVLAALAHFGLETTAAPQGWDWAVLVAMGLGPLGAAFFVWDHGTKHGDLRTLGAASYATPLLSTLLLVLFGMAVGDAVLWAACALIVGGALLASRDLWR